MTNPRGPGNPNYYTTKRFLSKTRRCTSSNFSNSI